MQLRIGNTAAEILPKRHVLYLTEEEPSFLIRELCFDCKNIIKIISRVLSSKFMVLCDVVIFFSSVASSSTSSKVFDKVFSAFFNRRAMRFCMGKSSLMLQSVIICLAALNSCQIHFLNVLWNLEDIYPSSAIADFLPDVPHNRIYLNLEICQNHISQTHQVV